MRFTAILVLFLTFFAPHVAAVTMKEKGPAAVGGKCGGFIGAVCGNKEWCDYPANAVCGIGDQQGTCKPRPEICIAIYLPVCGCDDVTYSNACVAASEGVDVAYSGRCRGDARKK